MFARNTEIHLLSFEQYANDAVIILHFFWNCQSNYFGSSNDGMKVLKLAMLYPKVCSKIITGFVLQKRDGAFSNFWCL
ncbi:MAG: hypothetical protein KA526_04530 [Chitinophagales bacterium]|nr:hypothetical protein [Chitinophagales bacterium]